MLFAVGILVHYAIDLGLFGRLPPAVRFALGLSIGLALLVLGEFVRRRGAPGASVGLEVAGIGSVLASIALGVFSLGLFGPATGALLAAAAGVLGAAWSLRSRSEAVGIAALVGILVLPATFGVLGRNGSPILGGLLVALGIATGLAMHLVAGNAFVRVRLYTLGAAIVLGAVAAWQFDDSTMTSAFALVWWGLFVASAVLCALRGTGVLGVLFGGHLGASQVHANGAVVATASVPLVLLQGLGGRGGGLVDVVDLLPLVAGGLLAGLALFLRGFGSVTPGEEAGDPEGESARARAAVAASRALARDFEALAILLGTLGVGFIAGESLRPAIIALGAAAALLIGSRLARPLVAAMACLLAVVAIGSILVNGLAFFNAPEVARFDVPFSGGAESVVLHASPAVGWGFGAAALLFGAGVAVGRGFVASWLGVFGGFVWILASFALLHRVGPIALTSLAGMAAALVPRPRDAGAAAAASATSLAVLGFLVWLGFVIGAHFSADWRSAAGLAWEYVPMTAALVLAAMRLASIGSAPVEPSSAASTDSSTAAATARIRLIPLVVVTLLAGAGLALLASLGARDAGAGRFEAALGATIGLAVAAMLAASVGRSLTNAGLAGAGALLAVLSAALASILGLGVLLDGAPGSIAWPSLAIGAIVAVGGASIVAHRALPRTSAVGRTAVVAAAAASVAPLGALAIASLSGGPLGAWIAGGWIVAVGVAELAVGFHRERAALRWAGLVTFGLLVLRLYVVDLAQAPVLVRVALLLVAGIALVGTGIVYARRAAGRRAPAAVPSPRADGETPASDADLDRSARG